MRIDARDVDAERPHAARHFDHLSDVPVVLELRLCARGAQDALVESRRGLLELPDRRGHPSRVLQRRLLLAALRTR